MMAGRKSVSLKTSANMLARMSNTLLMQGNIGGVRSKIKLVSRSPALALIEHVAVDEVS